MTPDFDGYALHDAVLYQIGIDWQRRSCWLEVRVFLDRQRPAVPCRISWTGLRSIHVPIEMPWGHSNCINAQAQEGNRFRIEMQSGDVISVEADHVAFSREGAL